MKKYAMNKLDRLSVSNKPPYDALQSFVGDNHIAIKGRENGQLANYKFAAKDVFKIKGSDCLGSVRIPASYNVVI